jgi:hypothetical protein
LVGTRVHAQLSGGGEAGGEAGRSGAAGGEAGGSGDEGSAHSGGSGDGGEHGGGEGGGGKVGGEGGTDGGAGFGTLGGSVGNGGEGTGGEGAGTRTFWVTLGALTATTVTLRATERVAVAGLASEVAAVCAAEFAEKKRRVLAATEPATTATVASSAA